MLVFIHCNKTGGTTLTHMLRSNFGVQHCQVEPWHGAWTGGPFSASDLKHLRRYYPRLKSIAGHRITGHVDIEDNDAQFKYFTLIRDPLKLCASRFQYRVQKNGRKHLVFEDWIQQEFTHNHQTKWIAGVEDVSQAIRIIKEKNIFAGLTERFDESMVLLKSRVANDLDISYKRVNVAPKNEIKDGLLSNERTRQMLIESQQADLELYDYIKHELYPSYQREYGDSLESDVATYMRTQTHGFNQRNLQLSRMKQYLLYKPLLRLYRKGVKIV